MYSQTDILQILQALSEAAGASGFEDDVVRILRPHAEKFGIVSEDKMRNLYCARTQNVPGRPTILLDAHTDEVSFIVQAVKPDGTLRFLPLGSWAASSVTGTRVRVRNALGEYIPGIVAGTPPHYVRAEDRNKVDLSTMSIDVGALSKEDALENFHIRIGEPIVPDTGFLYDASHDILHGKAFDDRLGCAALLRTLDLLEDAALPMNIVGAWACQEEVGTRGARVTASRVRPDIAIVFEGCPADDTCAEGYMVQTALKKGPMLRHMDISMITHPRFQRFALDIAEQHGIPVQSGVRAGGGTNGSAIHISGEGIPCIVIGIPVRYIHTPGGLASLADFESAARLAAAIAEALNNDILEGF